jgi:Family of unknown function (DUF6516)
MPRREPDFHEKRRFDDGATLEMKIYSVPSPVPGSTHRLKYSLFYGNDGRRLVGYDNERPKGVHRHFEGLEEPYTFSTVEQLVADFLNDVAVIRERQPA